MHAYEDLNGADRPACPAHWILAPAALALAALGTALNPPQIHELRIDGGTVLQPVALEHVMERRPQGPPPWGDVEQVSPEEVEEITAPAGDTRGAPGAEGGSGMYQRPD
ncbi:MAG: hypothetical protein LLP51_04430 [Halorhodospira halophila]|uniref:hypothetical protein n=1 Tax=Halorhodospira TaxID=85108 RepID=UPI0019112DA7|nr:MULTISPECIES: hypothetical protein [Halorhodospira]MBK5942469.1 hypothetical protein [Halorhodospira halophila]MCC3750629.1 hypothetical protein [Halorhodospira halophila]MCG5532019.1 hypothetical protein [Halorhodospira sp. 9621]MCG5538323.1 hypothetical protein [Halorhodospira sp. 9622]MCG5540079.1 hypothetical protein [Halorhodospira sp. M39old]